jgi:hypothetical protein
VPLDNVHIDAGSVSERTGEVKKVVEKPFTFVVRARQVEQ